MNSAETAAEDGQKAKEPKDKNGGAHMVAGGALPPVDVPLPAPPASAAAQEKSAATVPMLTREVSGFGALSAAKQNSAAAQKAAPPPRQQSGSGAAAGNNAQQLPPQVAPGNALRANDASWVTIFPQNGNVEWRIGRGGKIERSSDSDQTWQEQNSGVSTDLLAGSATTNDVCWIAGTQGTILRTTDSGAHWTNLNETQTVRET